VRVSRPQADRLDTVLNIVAANRDLHDQARRKDLTEETSILAQAERAIAGVAAPRMSCPGSRDD
jgi:hypothetical protein